MISLGLWDFPVRVDVWGSRPTHRDQTAMNAAQASTFAKRTGNCTGVHRLRSTLVSVTASGNSGETTFGAKRRENRLLYLAALGIGIVLGLMAIMLFTRV